MLVQKSRLITIIQLNCFVDALLLHCNEKKCTNRRRSMLNLYLKMRLNCIKLESDKFVHPKQETRLFTGNSYNDFRHNVLLSRIKTNDCERFFEFRKNLSRFLTAFCLTKLSEYSSNCVNYI